MTVRRLSRSVGTSLGILKPAFFRLLASDDSANVHPTKFAAVGGSSLAIAYIAGDGHWKLGTLLNDTALPIVAILDMNNNGLPEVVAHSDEGPAWNDVVLNLDNPYQRYCWDVTALGIIGGTM